MKIPTKGSRIVMLLALVMTFALTVLGQEQQAQSQSPYVNGKPVFVVIPRGNSQAALDEGLAGANIPMWSGSFTFQGTTFHFTMIGTNPANGSVTTNVPLVIVPLQFKFSDGTILSANSNVCHDTKTAVARFQGSPLIVKTVTFKPGGTNVGTTQYIDAFQRANFWTTVSGVSPNYHVLLSPVTVKPLQTITVGTHGVTQAGPCARIGEVDINFFDSKARALITSLAIPATSLPLFLDYNTFLTQGGGCCILGYHSATSTNHTYSFAAYSDPGIFTAAGIRDIHATSHELGEWMDDPFGNNIVPAWGNVGQVVGCQNNLEVGDPVTGKAFNVTVNSFTYHPEDLVFLPWFSRQSPSTSVNHWFTFLNTFSSPAAHCP